MLEVTGLIIGMQEAYTLLKDALVETEKMTAEWENTLVTIGNNTNQSTEAITQMGAAAVQIGQTTGASFDSIAHGIEHATNVTQDLASATAIANVATASAVSTGANAADVTNLLANAMHEYGLDVSTAATAQERMAEVQGNANLVMGQMHLATAESNTQLGDFTEATAKAVGIAANLGVSMTDVFAATSALTRHGFPDVYQAGTQVTDMLTHMMNPSKSAKDALQELANESGDQGVAHAFDIQNLASRGLVGTLDYLKQSMDAANLSSAQQEQIMNQIIPALRGGLGAAAAVGTAYADMNQSAVDLNDTTKTLTLTQEALDKSLDTTIGQLNVFKDNVGAVTLTVGGPLNSALKDALKGLNDGFEGWRAMTTALGTAGDQTDQFAAATKDAIGGLSTVNATASDAKGMFDALGTAIGGVTDHLSALSGVANAIGAFKDSMQGAGTTGNALLTVLNAVVPGIGAVTGAASQLVGALDHVGNAEQHAADMADADTAKRQALHDAVRGVDTIMQQETASVEQNAQAWQVDAEAVKAQEDATKGVIDANNILLSEVTQQATSVKASYDAQLQPLQEQLTLLNQQYQQQSAGLKVQADQIKQTYDAQIGPLQTQLDLLNQQHETESNGLSVAADEVKQQYDGQIHSLQTQLDSLNAVYDVEKGKLETAATELKNAYDQQATPLNLQLEKLKEQYDLASGPLKESIDRIKAGYDNQIGPLQHQLDLLNQQYEAQSRVLKAQEDGAKAYYEGQITPLQQQVDTLNHQYTDASAALNRQVQDITRSYQAQITPLQEQLDAMRNAVQYADAYAADQEKIANLQIQQAMLAAEGDPVKRGEIAAQLDINKAQEDALKLQEQKAQLQQQLGGGNLTDAQRADIELQLQDIALKQQLAGMTDQAQMDQLLKQQEIAKAQQEVTDLARQQSDAEQAMAEIPLEQHIQQLQQAEKDALAPLQDQLATMKEQHDLAVGPLQDAIYGLQQAEKARLAPIEQQLQTLQSQHDTAVNNLQGDIQSLTNQEYDRLYPMQQQEAALQLQQELATGPLNRALGQLKLQEDQRLAPINQQLAALDAQHAVATTPLQTAINTLTKEEQARLYPIQQQQAAMQLQYNLASGPLKDAINKLKDAEDAHLKPIQDAQTSMSIQHDIAVKDLQPAIDALTQKEKDALKPLQDQEDALKAQNQELQTEIDNWKQIVSLQQQAANPLASTSHHGTGGGSNGGPSGGPNVQDGPATATGAAIENSAQSWLGAAQFQGMCEAFVETAWAEAHGVNKPNWGGSAADAWQNFQKSGMAQSGSPTVPGSLVYFNWDDAGHVGVYVGGGQFISALDNGIQQMSISDYEKYNATEGAAYLGYVPPFQRGGQMAADGLAYLHAGEFVISQETSAALARQGLGYGEVEGALTQRATNTGGDTIVVNVRGSVVSERELIEAVHTGLLRKKRASPSLGLS